jgi:hypothetical protein
MFLVEGNRSQTRAAVISVQDGMAVSTLGDLSAFRREFHQCLTRRADALFELCDGAPRGAGVRMGVRDRHLLVVVAAG